MKTPFVCAAAVWLSMTVVSTPASGQESTEVHDHGAAVAHVQIGINPTWRPADWSRPEEGAVDSDPTDNDKLWLFSMPPTHEAATPGWPDWQQTDGGTFLVLTPVIEEGEHIAKPDDPNKVLYTCDFLYSRDEGYGDPHGAEHLDGWGSAFSPQGAWNLAGGDVDTVPAWDIVVRRERVSDNLDHDDFLMLLPDDTAVLKANGDTHLLPRSWQADKNAWSIHTHAGFYFWLDEKDDEVYVVVSVHDAGGMYQRSADVTIRFAKRVCRPIPGDVNRDGLVDLADLKTVIENWGRSGVYSGQPHESYEHDHDEHED